MSVLLGKGDGTFRPALRYGPLPGSTLSITTGDFDGNGLLDIAVGDNSASGGNVDVFLGVGDGTFGTYKQYPSSASFPNGMRSADLNGDGRLDLVVADLWTNRVTWLEGKGDGTFRSPVIYVQTSKTTVAADAVVGDFNGDGRLDLVTSNTSAAYITFMKNSCSP